MNKKSILYGAAILTAANFFTRILGFVYRILLSRVVGAEGMGLFQLVAPIHMLTITLVTSGLPIAVSRMVSKRSALKNDHDARLVVRSALMAVAGISAVVISFLLISLRFIAFSVLKEPRTYLSLLAFLPCILILGMSAVYNGYFYGTKNVHPPAASEMLEQILRVVLVIGILTLFQPVSAEHASAIAMVGTVIGELAGLIWVQYIYTRMKDPAIKARTTLKSKPVFSEIASIAVPITATRLISSLVQSINAVLIPQRLLTAGFSSSQALSQFGRLTGMAMPFVFLPLTLTSALSVIMVPNLTEHKIVNDWRAIQDKVSQAILLTSLAAFPVSAFFLTLSTPLTMLLYHDPEVASILFYLSPIIVPFCFQHTFSGMLNGLGKQNLGARNYLIGSSLLLSCTYFLISIPSIGVHGYVIGLLLSSCTTSLLNYHALLKYGRIRTDLANWVFKPLLASLCMAVTNLVSYHTLIRYSFTMLSSMLIAAAAGFIVFFFMILQMNMLPDRWLASLRLRQSRHNPV